MSSCLYNCLDQATDGTSSATASPNGVDGISDVLEAQLRTNRTASYQC